jgi:hypothetical protein
MQKRIDFGPSETSHDVRFRLSVDKQTTATSPQRLSRKRIPWAFRIQETSVSNARIGQASVDERSSHLIDRTFATEAEAKAFSQTKLEDGPVVFAGTNQSSLPKRRIPAREIGSWLVEETEPSTVLKINQIGPRLSFECRHFGTRLVARRIYVDAQGYGSCPPLTGSER